MRPSFGSGRLHEARGRRTSLVETALRPGTPESIRGLPTSMDPAHPDVNGAGPECDECAQHFGVSSAFVRFGTDRPEAAGYRPLVGSTAFKHARVIFSVEQGPDRRSFRLLGELDLSTMEDLIQHVGPVLYTTGDICLDLEGLEFIDSSGIRAVIALSQQLRAGCRVVLRSPVGEVA